jgi:hypothetical protein
MKRPNSLSVCKFQIWKTLKLFSPSLAQGSTSKFNFICISPMSVKLSFKNFPGTPQWNNTFQEDVKHLDPVHSVRLWNTSKTVLSCQTRISLYTNATIICRTRTTWIHAVCRKSATKERANSIPALPSSHSTFHPVKRSELVSDWIFRSFSFSYM